MAFEIQKLVDTGMTPHKAIEIYVEKTQSPNDFTDKDRQYLTVYNEYKSLIECSSR